MAEAETTRVSIVNYALVSCLGVTPSFSDDSNTSLGGTVDLVWPNVVDRCFGVHDWTFCRRTSKLVRKDEQPETGWRHAFGLPGDKVGDPLKIARDPRCEMPLRDFYLEGFEVHCNEEQLWARCRVLVDPKYWDPAFRAAFVVALGAALAVPVLQDTKLRDELEAAAFGTPSQGGAGGLFGRLIAQNRAASPVGSPLLADDPLTSARYS